VKQTLIMISFYFIKNIFTRHIGYHGKVEKWEKGWRKPDMLAGETRVAMEVVAMEYMMVVGSEEDRLANKIPGEDYFGDEPWQQ